MTELLTAAQMRAIEEAAIASGEVTGLELMERAGRGVVEAIFEEWPELAKASHRAVVLCWSGQQQQRRVCRRAAVERVGLGGGGVSLRRPSELPPDARVNYERWLGMGEVRALDCEEFIVSIPQQQTGTIVVDAIFGIGLSRPFDCNAVSWALLMSIFEQRGRQPAVAIRKGRRCRCAVRPDSDSGEFLTDPVPFDFELAIANLTVTFHGKKPGHAIGEGPKHCGKVVVKDIGLPQTLRGASAASPRPAPQGGGNRPHPRAGGYAWGRTCRSD
ncbi:MAG: NAD(P)H-hydrate epimerase [Defluviimonas denitrificans]